MGLISIAQGVLDAGEASGRARPVGREGPPSSTGGMTGREGPVGAPQVAAVAVKTNGGDDGAPQGVTTPIRDSGQGGRGRRGLVAVATEGRMGLAQREARGGALQVVVASAANKERGRSGGEVRGEKEQRIIFFNGWQWWVITSQFHA